MQPGLACPWTFPCQPWELATRLPHRQLPRGQEHIGGRMWWGKAKPGVPCSGCVATSFRGWSC